jgi:large subunit ribosomal protein L27
MSKVKASGKGNQQSQQKRAGKRLGVKKCGGEKVIPGNIIVRHRGAEYRDGDGVGMGRGQPLFSLEAGTVQFGTKHGKTVVSVVAE